MIYFIFGCPGSPLLCMGFSSCEERVSSPVAVPRFSLLQLLLLRSMVSRAQGFSSCSSRALEHSLSSCGPRAQLLLTLWDLPGPGIELVGLLRWQVVFTTEPPGKPHKLLYNREVFLVSRLIIGSNKTTQSVWSITCGTKVNRMK